MREIKFRGQTYDTPPHWVFGDLYHYTTGEPAINYPHPHKKWLESEPVRPATVGQFTGLLDANDKEIYEGDILLYRLPENMIALKNSDKSVVFYGHGMFLVSHGKIEFSVNQVLGVHGDGAVVIGNVHDSPELLEADDERD